MKIKSIVDMKISSKISKKSAQELPKSMIKKENKIFAHSFGESIDFDPGYSTVPKLLCMGSCDARNLHGCFFESEQDVVNSIYDIFYNPIALEQEFLRVFYANRNWEQLCYRFFDNGTKAYHFRDPWRSWIKAPSLSELRIINEQFDNISRITLREAKCLLLVLGLAETWGSIDKPGLALNRIPIELPIDQIQNRYYSHLCTRKELRHSLLNIGRVVRKNLPEIETIFTAVSPIPLKYSTQREGIIFSNYLNKLVLYQAVQDCCQRTSIFRYFPYYELVHSMKSNPWQEDQRHLKPEAIIAAANLFALGRQQTKPLSKHRLKKFFFPKVDSKGKINGKLFCAPL